MKVRTRVSLAITVTTVMVGVGVYLVTTGPLMSGFANLEDRRAREDVLRVDQALGQMVQQVHAKSVDWSNWDDTYQFMKDRNSAYLRSNMVAASFIDLKIDAVILLDSSNDVYYNLSVPRLKGFPLIDAQAVKNEMVEGGWLNKLPSNGEGKGGVLMYKGLPLAVSVRPIRNTEISKPSRGWFVFAQFLGSSSFADLQQVTNHNAINLSLKSAEAQELLPAFSNSVVELRPINESKLIGYSLVRDLKGRPAFVLKAEIPRQLTMQGKMMADATLFQFFAVGALFLVVILVVVDRFALSRITRLSQQVLEIGDTPEGARVYLDGKDELSGLADCMNAMFQKLDCNARRLRESEERLRIHNDRLEETVLERTQQIEHQAFHDKLTGLPNRALFIDRLRIALEKAKRSGTGTAALFLDLDNFKLINDSLGHDMGDQLLIEVSNRFAETVRPGDTVARLGGDEFTVLLEDVESEEEAGAIAERLLLCLRKPISLGSRETFVGASVGVAFTRDPEIGDVALLKNADTAMYRAKANGKSSHVVFNESMLDHAIERLELETDLRKSMENKELLVHFQPLIDLQTGKLTGAEALARWIHPTRGFVSPGQFIPIAEDTGLIIPIGYWILEQACLQAKDWIVEFDEPDFLVSVNLSGKQLQRDDVVDHVRATLELTGLPATNLKLEITESVLMEDRDDVISKMTGLKALGVHLALDDFGTGYSSLSTLRVFPIDTLKIDRAFISRLGSEDDAMAIVEAILGLARTMKMDVTGEGVETQAQSDLIRKLGCQTGQGYLYAKPLPAHEFSAQFSKSGTSEEQKRAA